MQKYFALYKASPEQFKKWMSSSQEEQQKGMDAWKSWVEKHKEHVADEGAPLSKVKQVTSKEVKDVHNDIGGYMIIQANSLDEAAKIMQDSPHFAGGEKGISVEVMEMPSWSTA